MCIDRPLGYAMQTQVTDPRNELPLFIFRTLHGEHRPKIGSSRAIHMCVGFDVLHLAGPQPPSPPFQFSSLVFRALTSPPEVSGSSLTNYSQLLEK